MTLNEKIFCIAIPKTGLNSMNQNRGRRVISGSKCKCVAGMSEFNLKGRSGIHIPDHIQHKYIKA